MSPSGIWCARTVSCVFFWVQLDTTWAMGKSLRWWLHTPISADLWLWSWKYWKCSHTQITVTKGFLEQFWTLLMWALSRSPAGWDILVVCQKQPWQKSEFLPVLQNCSCLTQFQGICLHSFAQLRSKQTALLKAAEGLFTCISCFGHEPFHLSWQNTNQLRQCRNKSGWKATT